MAESSSFYWLFWDGECGFCRRIVAWAKRRDTADVIRAVPYQDAPRPPMTDGLAERCRRAIHVMTPQGRTLAAGRASMCILGLIGYPRLARIGALRPCIWGVEIGYWLVARNRRFFSRLLPREQI